MAAIISFDKTYGSCTIKSDSSNITKIERSIDENNWTVIYEGKEGTTGIASYTDYTCEYGEKYYYRLNNGNIETLSRITIQQIDMSRVTLSDSSSISNPYYIKNESNEIVKWDMSVFPLKNGSFYRFIDLYLYYRFVVGSSSGYKSARGEHLKPQSNTTYFRMINSQYVEWDRKYVTGQQEGKNFSFYASDIILYEKRNYVNTYFEDAILYDASIVNATSGDAAQEKPQVIRFNQNISSLKINQADSVTQTLGSRYPIIRRSGHVNYKSFTIGGLISVLANTQGYNGDRTLLERKFRDEFLDILGNGNVKLFKSGPEGNMIIRITGGITLSPENALGRDIYSFSAQATEVAAPTPENLRALGFFDPTKFLTVQQTSSTDNDVFFTVGE